LRAQAAAEDLVDMAAAVAAQEDLENPLVQQQVATQQVHLQVVVP